MFKSLLQTIPTISGNFTLACKLNNYTKNNHKEYTSYINDAILMPLDNNYNLTKDIKINLINSKYEFDVMKYFKEMSSTFYNDTYLKNNNIFETYSENILPDNRDKNFEFGCKRISYNKYQYQYQFYAPIYINNVDDIPDEFVIEIYTENAMLKKIHIPINKKYAANKLRIYLNKYISKIENNTPIVWNFGDNKIIYKNAIDCKNGGLITMTSYNTINSNDVYQTIINDIDNLICQNYAQNNIILGECIPLSFLFNINDLLESNDSYYYHFNQFNILGYYVKNNLKCKYYTFSTNYHHNYSVYNVFNNLTNSYKKINYNLFDNDIVYSLKEGTNYLLYYQNTFKNKYCQWKLLESDSYIINLNSVFTYTSLDNKFPVFKNSLKYQLHGIFDTNILYIPINNYVNIYNTYDQNQYNLLINNNYNNWFTSDYKTYPVSNNYAFINGIRYYISDNSIKHLGISINPHIVEYNPNILVGNVILEKHKDSNGFPYYTYNEENNNYYVECEQPTILDNQDDIVYTKYNMNIKYVEYENYGDILFDEYDYPLIDFYKNQKLKSVYLILSEILANIYSIDFSEDIEKIHNIDSIYKEKYNSIFNTYFDQKIGYSKITIPLESYTENELLNIFNKDKSLRNKIYYSLPNTKDKNNLYYNLYKKTIDYKYLLDNNITLFEKKTFIEINNIDNFYINIFGANGLRTSIYDKCYINNNTITTNQQLVNSFIEYLDKNLISDNTNWFYDEIFITKINSLYTNSIIEISSDLQFKEMILNNLFNKLVDLIIYVIIYTDIINYINRNNISIYKYIPYYNDNNIIINYDYYEKLYKNVDYYNLYTNIPSNNFNMKDVYILIDNIDMYNYYINNNDIFDIDKPKLYHKQIIIDGIQETYQLINIAEYINDYIVNNILINDNNLDGFYIDNHLIDKEYLTNTLSNDEEYYKLLITLVKNNLKVINNNIILEIICISKDNQKIYQLPINLYFRQNVYLLTTSLNTYDAYSEPLIIYQEIPVEHKYNTLVNIIYNDFSTHKKQNFKYEQIKKNLLQLNDRYVYYNPYYYFIKTTVNDYLNDYNENKVTTYRKVENINEFKINTEINDDVLYINIDYYIMLSTNLFNIYNVDNNDNFEITYINNIKITDENIKELFKIFYPYLKQDILLNFIIDLNNSEIPVNVILPSNIKCKINTLVNKKPDNKIFTNISLSDDILQILYLNRYFGNIDPYFIEVNQLINNIRSKVYIITEKSNIDTNNLSDNDNVYIENVNIYKYNSIPYYTDNKNSQLLFTKQLEYKHFNNNYLFNLPNELYINVNDIEYIYIEQLKDFINKDSCLKYFRKYLKKYFINNKIVNDENLFLYIFNKYSIEYIQHTELNKVLQKVYKITYKLTLI